MRGHNYRDVLWKTLVVFNPSYFSTCSKIELEEKYRNQTCGLCGDNNGVRGDFINQGESKIYIYIFSWNVTTKGRLQTVWTSVTFFIRLQKPERRWHRSSSPTCGNWTRAQTIARTLPPNPKSPVKTRCVEKWRTRSRLRQTSLMRLCLDPQLSTCKDFLVGKATKSCQKVVDTPAFLKACMIDLRYKNSSSVSNLCSTMAEFSHHCAHFGGTPKPWLQQLCGKEPINENKTLWINNLCKLGLRVWI